MTPLIIGCVGIVLCVSAMRNPFYKHTPIMYALGMGAITWALILMPKG